MSSYYNKKSTMKPGKRNYKAATKKKPVTKPKKTKPTKSIGMKAVLKDIVKRVTRGGLEMKKRTDRRVKKAGG